MITEASIPFLLMVSARAAYGSRHICAQCIWPVSVDPLTADSTFLCLGMWPPACAFCTSFGWSPLASFEDDVIFSQRVAGVSPAGVLVVIAWGAICASCPTLVYIIAGMLADRVSHYRVLVSTPLLLARFGVSLGYTTAVFLTERAFNYQLF